MIPNDPIILLSYVNTQLRDFYSDLDSFCEDKEVDLEELKKKLKNIGYVYDTDRNQFR